MKWLGIDVGGANLKFATADGFSHSIPFPLWRQPERLADAIAAELNRVPQLSSLAVTMTGELADCFATKQEGIAQILDAVEFAAQGRRVLVYSVERGLTSLESARKNPLQVAAANWHALASYACRFVTDGTGLLIDIGSTTTDIVPISPNDVKSRGTIDSERLQCRELVYTGVRRTPLCGLVDSLPWRGKPCPVAAELFATTADAYILLGELAEDVARTDTADGRPCTASDAGRRIARMICADITLVDHSDLLAAAQRVCDAQVRQIELALGHVTANCESPVRSIVLSGEGEFLSRSIVRRWLPEATVFSLAEHIGASASSAACAFALAQLADSRPDVARETTT